MSGLALDRGWRTRAAVAVLAGVGAVAAPAWYLRAIQPLDALYHHPVYPDQVFAALLAGALVLIAAWQGYVAWRDRERTQQRRAAIAGNTNTMPRASQTYDWRSSPGAPHAATGQPLVVEFRASRSLRRILGPAFLLLFGPGTVLFSFLVLSVAVQLATLQFGRLEAFYAPGKNGSSAGLPFTLGVVLAILPIAVSITRSSWNETFQLFWIEASGDGVRWRGRWGRERLIRWEDARLFEISTFRRLDAGSRHFEQYYRYTLYSREARIRWDNNRDFLTREMRGAFSQLLAAISQHGGLAPRTASPALSLRAVPGMRGPWGIGRGRDARLGAFAVFWLLYSAFLLAMLIVAPPTTSLALNTIIAVALLGMVAFVGWLIQIHLRTALRLWQQTKDDVAARHGGRLRPIPFPSLFQVNAAMRQAARTNWESDRRRLWLYRVGVLALMAALSAAALPPIAALWFHGMWPWTHMLLVPPGFATVFAYLLALHGLIGLIGFPVCIVALILIARGVISADNWLAPPV